MRREYTIGIGLVGVLLLVAILAIVLRGGGDNTAAVPTMETAQNTTGVDPVPAQRQERAAPAQKAESAPMPAVEAPPADRMRFQGRVLAREDEMPIADAEVSVFFDVLGTFDNPLTTVYTDGTGYYDIELEKDRLPREFAALGVRAEGYTSEIDEVYTANGRMPRETIKKDFLLAPGKTLRGIVVDKADAPVAEAKIGAYQKVSYTGLRSDSPNETFPVAESGADGRFELRGVRMSDQTILLANKRGYLPAQAGPMPMAPDETIKIVMEEGEAGISGQVFSAEGDPVPNTPVKAIYMKNGAQPDFRYPRGVEPNINEIFTKTDDQGFYEFDALRSGWQLVIAGHGMPVGPSTLQSVMLQPGDYIKMNLRFRAPITVRGRVIGGEDGEQGVPAVVISDRDPSADVPANMLRNLASRTVATGNDGRFEIQVEPTAEMDIFAPLYVYYQPPPQYQITPNEWLAERLRPEVIDGKDEVVIRLQEPISVTGIVYMPDGETPAAGAEVQVNTWGNPWIPGGANGSDTKVTTDPEGRFTAQVRSRGRLTATATLGELSASEGMNIQGSQPPQEIELVLRGRGSIIGRVLGPEDNPVGDVQVELNQRGRRWGGSIATAITDADGTYRFEDVLEGGLRVEITPGEYGRGEDEADVTVASGEEIQAPDLKLLPSISMEGVVLTSGDEPIEGATITEVVRRGRNRFAGEGLSTTSDSEGKFRLEGLADSDNLFALSVTHPAYEEKQLENLIPEDSPLTVVLTRRPRLEFTAYYDGAQVTDFEYTITTTSRGGFDWDSRGLAQRSVFSQEDPVVETLDPGEYSLHIYGLDSPGEKNGLYGYEKVTLAEDSGTVTVGVTLEYATTIRGVVVDTDDRALEGVNVELRRPEIPFGRGPIADRMGGRMEAVTDSAGAFVFDNVPIGEAIIRARMDGLTQTEEIRLNIENGVEIDPLKIVMGPLGAIYGTAIDIDGEPMEGARIELVLRRNEGQEQLGADGVFRFEELQPGGYTLSLFSSDGEMLQRERVELAPSEEREVNFDFSDGYVAIHGEVLRNGNTDSARNLRLRLMPKGNDGETAVLLVSRGNYEARVKPAEYDVYIYSEGGNVMADSGLDITVTPQPGRQEIRLPLILETVDVVIVLNEGEDTLERGTFRYIHQSLQGASHESEFGWSERLFSIGNQPHGRCRAVFRTENGQRYVSDWIDIEEGGEMILTLLPEDVMVETGG